MAEFITLQDVCELLKLSDRAVYDLCRQGRLPGAAKVGGSWRIDKQKLLEWMARGGDAAADPAKHGNDE